MSKKSSRKYNRRRKGAGFIFTTPESKFLLVQECRGLKWGFCKGHTEREDLNSLTTAIREANEELGLTSTDYKVTSRAVGIADYSFFYATLHKAPEDLAIHEGEIAAIKAISLESLLASIRDCPGNYNRFVRAWVQKRTRLY
jgi:8-oxo-dGTP pyrophosphatase MutT (NUDIX family)